MENNSAQQPDKVQPAQPMAADTPRTFPTGKKELIFGAITLLSAMALVNFVLFGGFHLGFALAAAACMLGSFCYLLAAGCRPDAYGVSLLVLSLIIALGFARSDDGFVKFVMVCFLLVGVNLCLCLTAKQNLYAPGSVRSLLDAPRAMLQLGIGRSPEVCQGLVAAFRRSGSVGKKGSAFLLGLGICVPILAVVIPLLVSADAAFDGLMGLLPEFDFEEFLATVLLGGLLGCVLYSRGVALRHSPRAERGKSKWKGISVITVNTVLGAVCGVYFVYLVSQLAYLAGGFAGILPEGYTVAQYARRGFFEMALLSAINLAVMVLSLGLVHKEKRTPLSTRLLCLFIGIVTLFLAVTASAKMLLYIGTYGMTQLRVLTQIIMLFFAITTVIVMVWLFVPKLPYMKAVLLVALAIGGAVIWADVDTCVARYNVDAYLSGRLESVDVWHLGQLSDGAVPSIDRLAREAQDETVAQNARTLLENWDKALHEGFRGWNYVNHMAAQYLPEKDQE